jgi:hypothetical protein
MGPPPPTVQKNGQSVERNQPDGSMHRKTLEMRECCLAKLKLVRSDTNRRPLHSPETDKAALSGSGVDFMQ